jgi:hypothetical protein
MARCLFLLMALARLSRCDEEYQFWEAAGSGDVGAMAAVLAEVPNLDLEHLPASSLLRRGLGGAV